MKIFVLMWDGGYDGYGSLKMFSSIDKAIAYWNSLSGLSKGDYTIQEHLVDGTEDDICGEYFPFNANKWIE